MRPSRPLRAHDGLRCRPCRSRPRKFDPSLRLATHAALQHSFFRSSSLIMIIMAKCSTSYDICKKFFTPFIHIFWHSGSTKLQYVLYPSKPFSLLSLDVIYVFHLVLQRPVELVSQFRPSLKSPSFATLWTRTTWSVFKFTGREIAWLGF